MASVLRFLGLDRATPVAASSPDTAAPHAVASQAAEPHVNDAIPGLARLITTTFTGEVSGTVRSYIVAREMPQLPMVIRTIQTNGAVVAESRFRRQQTLISTQRRDLLTRQFERNIQCWLDLIPKIQEFVQTYGALIGQVRELRRTQPRLFESMMQGTTFPTAKVYEAIMVLTEQDRPLGAQPMEYEMGPIFARRVSQPIAIPPRK